MSVQPPNNGRPATPTQALVGVASSLIDNLKSSPAILAIVILNIVVLSVIYFTVSQRSAERHAEFRFLLEHCQKP
jgi:hypothetical protein